METISYLLLDAFVVFLAFAVFLAVLKKSIFLFLFSLKLVKQLKPSLTKSGATPVVERQQKPRKIQTETNLLTSFPEQRDWSQYDSPVCLRKGILIH